MFGCSKFHVQMEDKLIKRELKEIQRLNGNRNVVYHRVLV